MSRTGKYGCPEWDADPRHQRIAVDRRGSESNYDHRRPGNRTAQSYYGPNFREIEKGRTQSFNHRIEPKMPKPYVKNPQPYPPHVAQEHSAYKQHQKNFGASNQEYKRINPLKPGGYRPEVREGKFREGLAVATQARIHANLEAASRSGFDHKYPCAYENHANKKNHAKNVDDNKTSARRYKKSQAELRAGMDRWGYQH